MSEELDKLRGAFIREVARQHDEGHQPGNRVTIDGLMVLSDRPDVFAVFDGEIRMTPVIQALCQELRKMPERQMVKLIGQVAKGQILG